MKFENLRYTLRLCKAREIHNNERLARLGRAESHSNALGILCYAINAPFFYRNRKGVFFDSVGEAFSKSGVAYQEILKSSFLRYTEKIVVGSERKFWSYFARSLRIVFYGFLYFPAIIRIRKSIKLTNEQKAVIVGALAFDRYFKRNPESFPLVMSDVSINYLPMALGGSRHAGIMWWQDDYHYRNVPSFKLVAAGLMSRALSNDLIERNACIRILPRKSSVEQMKIVGRFNKIGAAVNATFTAAPDQVEMLGKLKLALGVSCISLRLHPTSPRSISLPSWVVLAPSDESVVGFAKRHDLIFVGNSAIQLKIAAAGTPVFHVENLDVEGFDLYEYVKLKLIFGAKSVDEFELSNLCRFYARSEYQALLVKALE